MDNVGKSTGKITWKQILSTRNLKTVRIIKMCLGLQSSFSTTRFSACHQFYVLSSPSIFVGHLHGWKLGMLKAWKGLGPGAAKALGRYRWNIPLGRKGVSPKSTEELKQFSDSAFSWHPMFNKGQISTCTMKVLFWNICVQFSVLGEIKLQFNLVSCKPVKTHFDLFIVP